MNKKLYVASLPFGFGNKELEEMFGAIGTVVSAKIIMNPSTGLGKGFGFVEMSSEEEAEQAIAQLNGSSCAGRTILVSKAKTV